MDSDCGITEAGSLCWTTTTAVPRTTTAVYITGKNTFESGSTRVIVDCCTNMSSLLVYNPNDFCLAGAIPGGGGRGDTPIHWL